MQLKGRKPGCKESGRVVSRKSSWKQGRCIPDFTLILISRLILPRLYPCEALVAGVKQKVLVIWEGQKNRPGV